jgi:DNA repair protein SbcC/Rad50
MRLLRLDIQSLPGIEPGFVLDDLAPGINLVTGPNAVGKSSLLRALRCVVVPPGPRDPPALAVNAAFLDGGRWTARRSGSQQSWELDGRAADRPSLPEPEDLQAYWVSMENLLAAAAGDERLVSELRRALAGGFDLRTLRAGLTPPARLGQAEQRALSAARDSLRAAAAHYEALRIEETALPGLRARIEAARAAARQAQQLAEALILADARAAREAAAAVLATFPAGMDALRGNEREELERIDSRRHSLREGMAGVVSREEAARAALAATGLAEERPAEAELDGWLQRLAAAQRQRDQLDDRRGELEQALARNAAAQAALGSGVEPPRLTPATLQQAEPLARALHGKSLARAELVERIEETGEPPQEGQVEHYALAAAALRSWLTGRTRNARLRRMALAVAFLAAAVALGFGAWIADWAVVAASAAALLAVAGAALAERQGAGDPAVALALAGLDAPSAWEPEAVEEKLAEIEQALAVLREQRARAESAALDRRRLERLECELESLEVKRVTLAQEQGFDPAITATGLDHFARLSTEWHEARQSVAALNAAVRRLQGEVDTTSGAVQGFLDRWHCSGAGGLDGLAAALRGLAGRSRAAAAARQQIEAAGLERANLRRSVAELHEDETRLYARAGLPFGERESLLARLERLDSWRAQREELLDAERRVAAAEQALAGEPALAGRAVHGERVALAEEHTAARADADGLEGLLARCTRIETRLADAGADRRLATAQADVDMARAALADGRDSALLAEAGLCLLDGVEAEHRSEHEPALMSDARERFREFTHHDWDVILDENDELTALDLRQGARRGLEALSSGTRMQLLLALRVAWIRSVERGRARLPLFFDEALTTSDEQRFAAVARSLQRLADDEERQVFYLSARRQELELWRRATGRAPHHVDLAAVRFGAAVASPSDYTLPETAAVPPPGELGPEAYAAQVGVPALDSRLDAGAVHLFHLLRDDLSLLHRLMNEWRIDSLGQLEALLQSRAAAAAVPDDRWRQVLSGRCAAARAWLQAWRLGRGKPVDRGALEASGALTARFLDPVSALAEKLGGDGRRLVEHLQAGDIARLRSSSIDDLAEWLSGAGYIDPAEVLDAAGRERTVLLALGDRVESEQLRRVVGWLEAGMAGIDD